MILDHLEYELLNQDEVKTMLLSSEDGSFEEDIKIINSTKWISVFVAGLVKWLKSMFTCDVYISNIHMLC